jgi:AbrB family looped-hinge helix DNA binding protein
MSKVTSKLQVTVPKAIAERFNIKPGDRIEWEAAGEIIRVVPARKQAVYKTASPNRLKHFDRATERQRERQSSMDPTLLRAAAREGRGWARADLYDRGSAD